jgi:hypothetical protein
MLLLVLVGLSYTLSCPPLLSPALIALQTIRELELKESPQII